MSVDTEPKQEEKTEKDDGARSADSHLGVLNIAGEEVKILDIVTILEIRVAKLENGKEATQCVAQEYLMLDHKRYLIFALCDAIMTVMKTTSKKLHETSKDFKQRIAVMGTLVEAMKTFMKVTKEEKHSRIKLASTAMFNKIKRLHNRSKGGAFGGGKIIH